MKGDAELTSYVLVVTRTHDPTADHVLHRMTDRNIPYLRLNSENFGMADVVLRFPNVLDSTLSIEGARISLGNIRGVWLRRLMKPKTYQNDPEERTFAQSELDFTLRWLIALLGNYCPVLDLETRILEGRNKFDQMAIAEKFGLHIPATLVTNNPVAARDFVKVHKTAAIKSVAGYGRQVEDGFYTVYTNVVSQDILDRFDSIRAAPVCLQEYIDKEFELRVTIVGQKVFASRIDSQAAQQTKVDWRRYGPRPPQVAYPIDPELSGRLIAMMQYYGIRFASFDLIVTPDGRTIFLEMNPATEYLWVELDTGMPISDAIIDEILVRAEDGPQKQHFEHLTMTRFGLL